MNEKFARYREQAKQYWGQYSRKHQIVIVSTFLMLIIIVVMLIVNFSRTEYELAFQNLDNTDAAAIMQHLDAQGIPYTLSLDGTSISVPSAVASRARVDVGSQGLVRNGSIGFDMFGQSSSTFGRTDNEFNVMYRNALNGEIQQLLNGMQGVRTSQVLVTLPEESVFMNAAEERASASIRLNFVPGYRPSQSEIDGYYNLVKTAVPNLAIEDITISSNEAELFPSARLNEGSLGSQTLDTQFQIQRKYESEIKRNVQEFLGRIYGLDNLVIIVSSSMNFDQRSSTEMLVQPLPNNNNNGIVISREETSRISTGSEGQAGGVVGTGESDVPGYEAADSAATSSSEESTQVVNYEISRVTNQIVSAPYVVRDLSISVGLGSDALTEEDRDNIAVLLRSFVTAQLSDSGQNVEDEELMGRKVQVITQPFAANAGAGGLAGVPLPWAIGIGAAALVVLGGGAYVLLRRRKQAELARAAEEAALLEPSKVEYPTIDLDNAANDNQVRKQLEQLAKKKPDEFVNLLRTWLVDE